MTIKINMIKGIWILLCLFIFFESCNNKDKLVGEYYLTEEMKQTIPFDGSETLYFIDSVDTIVLDQGKRKNYLTSFYISQTEYVHLEFDYADFSTLSGNYYIINSLKSNYNNDPGTMSIIWAERDASELKSKSTYFFKLPLSTTTLEQGQWFLDEMEVCGVNYANVYCDSIPYTGGYTWPNEPKTVYYTEEYGIVKIEFTQGNTWELLKIDWE